MPIKLMASKLIALELLGWDDILEDGNFLWESEHSKSLDNMILFTQAAHNPPPIRGSQFHAEGDLARTRAMVCARAASHLRRGSTHSHTRNHHTHARTLLYRYATVCNFLQLMAYEKNVLGVEKLFPTARLQIIRDLHFGEWQVCGAL